MRLVELLSIRYHVINKGVAEKQDQALHAPSIFDLEVRTLVSPAPLALK